MEENNFKSDIAEKPGITQGIDIAVLLDNSIKALKKLLWVAVVLALVASGILCIRARNSYVPIYKSSATFTIKLSTDYGTSNDYYNSSTATQLSETFPYILESGLLSDAIENDMGISVMPCTMEAVAIKNANLFTLSVTSNDPQLSYNTLESAIKLYPSVAQFVIGDVNLEFMDETGVATAPINSVDYKDSVKKGCLYGGGVGALLIAFYAFTYSTVRKEDDIKQTLNMRCLGSVPRIRIGKSVEKSKANLLVTNKRISQIFNESIRLIRTRTERIKGAKTFVVTSTLAGEGKTTVSVNLAISLAEKGHKVVLIDGDLRNPSIIKTLQMEGITYGLSDYLAGIQNAGGLQQKILGFENLTVIPCVKSVKTPSELISSDNMSALVKAARDYADYVIIDAPPCSVITDAAEISKFCDHVLFVIKQDCAKTEQVMRSIESISESNSEISCVLNNVEYGIVYYGSKSYQYGKYRKYKYGYGYNKYGYGYGGSKYGDYSHYNSYNTYGENPDKYK